MLKEFREFIAKGNVLDLAVGIIIGAAFTGIVNSFVKDILSPLIGLFGKANLDANVVVLKEASSGGEPVVLRYGAFLTNVVNFLIVAFAVFLIVKAVNRVKSRFEKPVEASVAGPTRTEVLLEEIRDALRKGS